MKARKKRRIFRAISDWMREDRRRTKMAADEMDRRYPGGWAQSATNMTELSDRKKRIRGGGTSW